MTFTNCLYRNLCQKSFTRYVECVRRYCNESRVPKFSTSPAYRGGRAPTPIGMHPTLSKMDVYSSSFKTFQTVVCGISVGCLIFYLLQREPNDIDEMLDFSRPLYKSVPIFEKELLNEQIMLAKHRGDPPEVILEYQKRLEEIERELKLMKNGQKG